MIELFYLGLEIFGNGIEFDSILIRADRLYENRHLDSNYIVDYKRIIDSLLVVDSTNSEAIWRLGRYYYERGVNSKGKNERLAHLSSARRFFEKSIALNESCEAHFFLGATLGRIGQTRGKMKSLFLVKPIKQSFTRSLELNPRYVRALAGLGSLFDQLPSIAGGDQASAVDYLKKAIEIDSNYTYPYIALARIFIARGARTDARVLLEKALKIKSPTFPADFFLEDRPEALSLLKEID